MSRETLQQIYDRHYSGEPSEQMRAANLLSDLRAWCKVNGCYIDQVFHEAAEAISFPLETTRTTPSLMWMDEDVLCANDLIPAPPGLQRRAATADAMLDCHDKNRRIAMDMIVVDLLRSLQHRPSLFYDCAEIADQVFEALVKMD